MTHRRTLALVLPLTAVLLTACGGGEPPATAGRGGLRSMGGRSGGDDAGGAAAVPVRTEVVALGEISDDLQLTGTLEAEEEVDLVARGSGPVTEIRVEEGDRVAAGALLARLDDREARNLVQQRTVTLDDARLAADRAETQRTGGLISQEAYDTTAAALATAEAQLDAARIQLADTEIRAPYDGVISVRYVKRDQYVSPGTALFRIYAADPLLCRVRVPEKDLTRLAVGQTARLTVEAFADQRFEGRVQRIRPAVDAATGTVTVTVEVRSQGRLRPGMFASVAVATNHRRGVVVIPRDALVLDAIGDVVFVVADGVAQRREVELGVRSDDRIEVRAGLDPGDRLVVLGQDGLADGTPVSELGEVPESGPAAAAGPDPAMLEHLRQRMKERGLSDQEIEQRLAEIRAGGGPPGTGPGAGGPPGGPGAGGLPPFVVERIKHASPEELDQIRARMRERGMSDEQVEAAIRTARGEGE